MNRKKKALIIFLVVFFVVMAFFILLTNGYTQNLAVNKTNALIISFLGSAACAMIVVLYYWGSLSIKKASAKARGISLPYQASDGSYAYPKLYFTTDIGQSIFGDAPCTAFLYKNRIIFRSEEYGYERKAIELTAENILEVQLCKKNRTVQEVRPNPFALFEMFIFPLYEKNKVVTVKKKFCIMDVIYKNESENLVIGIEDDGNGNGFEFCKKLKKLYGINVKEMNENEIYMDEYLKI